MQSFMAMQRDPVSPAPAQNQSVATPGLADPQQSYRDSFAMLQHYKAQQQAATLRRSSGSVSLSRMRALEKLFVNASQNVAPVAPPIAPPDTSILDLRAQQVPAPHVPAPRIIMTNSSVDSRSQHRHRTYTRERSASQGASYAEGSFAEGLDDMSLPSMSIGEISDFTSMGGGESCTRSKRSVGGTIVETSERSSCSMSTDGPANSGNHPSARQPAGVSNEILSQERRLEHDRLVSFTARPNEVAHAPLQQHQGFRASQSHGSSNHSVSSAGSKHSAAQKKQRRSLSSYYRELKTSHEPSDRPLAVDNNDHVINR